MKNQNNKNIGYMSSLEAIYSASTGCKLQFDRLNSVREDIDKVSTFLGISPMQTLLFASMVEKSFHESFNLEDLFKHLDCSFLKLLTQTESGF
jgi:hypothetical protein